jgi:hypothetical protein
MLKARRAQLPLLGLRGLAFTREPGAIFVQFPRILFFPAKIETDHICVLQSRSTKTVKNIYIHLKTELLGKAVVSHCIKFTPPGAGCWVLGAGCRVPSRCCLQLSFLEAKWKMNKIYSGLNQADRRCFPRTTLVHILAQGAVGASM